MSAHHVGPLLPSVLLLKFENKLTVKGLHVFVENLSLQRTLEKKMFDERSPFSLKTECESYERTLE